MQHPQEYKTRVEIGCPRAKIFEKTKRRAHRKGGIEAGRLAGAGTEAPAQAEPVKSRITDRTAG